MKTTIHLVAVCLILTLAVFALSSQTVDAGFGYGYGYSSCYPTYFNSYCTPVYSCVPRYFDPCYYNYPIYRGY